MLKTYQTIDKQINCYIFATVKQMTNSKNSNVKIVLKTILAIDKLKKSIIFAV